MFLPFVLRVRLNLLRKGEGNIAPSYSAPGGASAQACLSCELAD